MNHLEELQQEIEKYQRWVQATMRYYLWLVGQPGREADMEFVENDLKNLNSTLDYMLREAKRFSSERDKNL